MKLSIIIPCFNERETVSKIINKIFTVVKIKFEIILIDDCSTDGTKEILHEIKKKYENLIIEYNEINRGKGFCIKQGIKKASGDLLIVQDADLEYDPSDYEKILKPLINNNADVVFGTRFFTSNEKRVLYFWHSLGNKFLTLLSNCLSNLNLSDMECCYKAFKISVIKNINLKENRFGFEPEVTAKIAKKNLRIYEIGVDYHGRKYSEGKKITWKDGFSAIFCIIKYNLFD